MYWFQGGEYSWYIAEATELVFDGVSRLVGVTGIVVDAHRSGAKGDKVGVLTINTPVKLFDSIMIY